MSVNVRLVLRSVGIMTVSACLTAALLGNLLQVDAAGFHQYSKAKELTAPTNFTALKARRPDQAVSGVPTNGCINHFPVGGNPVYETQWLILGSTADWYEIGTAHQCNDTFRYWFWGYGLANAWYPLGTQDSITNGVSHWFTLTTVTHNGSQWMDYTIDGVIKDEQPSPDTASAVWVGLESYAQGASTSYDITSLQYQRNQGAWTFWAGRDGSEIDNGMCGGWVTDSWWLAGEPSLGC